MTSFNLGALNYLLNLLHSIHLVMAAQLWFFLPLI